MTREEGFHDPFLKMACTPPFSRAITAIPLLFIQTLQKPGEDPTYERLAGNSGGRLAMELLDTNAILFWRAAERLLNVIIGGGSIYLGYRLFINLPDQPAEGEGKLFLPGDVSVYVGRVGPGVFFALFGAAIVFLSFLQPFRATGPAPSGEVAAATAEAPLRVASAETSISYLSGQVEAERVRADRGIVLRDLQTMGTLEGALNRRLAGGQADISEADANSLLIALPRIKRLMLLDVWDEAWGDRQAFAEWVQRGATGDPPPGLSEIAGLFRAEAKE